MTTPGTPPGFRPPGEVPTFQGKPLAAPDGKKYGLVALGFVLLAVIAGVGFFRSFGDTESSSAVFDGTDELVPPFVVSARPSPRPTAAGPVPKPVTYRGTGSKTIAVRKPEPGPVLVYVKGANANGLFQVSSLDEDGRSNGLVAHSLKPYEGVRLVDDVGFQETAKLTIEATGPWTVQLRSVRSAPAFGSATSGSGDAVLRYTGRAGTATIRGGAPYTAFTVTTHVDDFPKLLVVAAGTFDDTRPWPAGPVLVEVESAARWSIRVR